MAELPNIIFEMLRADYRKRISPLQLVLIFNANKILQIEKSFLNDFFYSVFESKLKDPYPNIFPPIVDQGVIKKKTTKKIQQFATIQVQ